MYQLYYNRERKEIKIKPLEKIFQRDNLLITEELYEYNDCYYFCKSRKILKEKAEEIKVEWIKELEEEINGLKSIEIK